jgi:hypothetical protein
MSEVAELTPATGRSALVLSSLLPAAATLAAIAFLIFSAVSSERITADIDALSFDGDAESNETFEFYAHNDLDEVAAYLKTSLASGDARVELEPPHAEP